MITMEKWKQLMVSIILLFVGVPQVLAFGPSPRYYAYKTNLSVSPTGAGSVYATYTSSDFVRDHTRDETPTTGSRSYEAVIYSRNNTITMNLHAEASDGFRFVRWVDENNNPVGEGSAPTLSLVYSPGSASYEWVSTGIFSGHWAYTNFKEFNYKAIFREAGSLTVKVAERDKNVGTAYIKEEHYEEGDEVTLVASTAGGSELLGWAFDYWELNGEKVSESAEYKVVVPPSQVTYIAHFIKASDEYYCFIRNKQTQRYLKLSKVIDSYTATVNTSNETFTSNFNGALTLINANAAVPPISDPGCVFIVSGFEGENGLKNATLISQAIPMGYLSGSKIIKRAISINPVSTDVYTISTPYNYNGTDYDTYFRDNNGTFDVHPTIDGEKSQWEIIPLNTANIDKQFFGVTPTNANMKQGDYYYTTLYTTFPYQLKSDGMKAYYIDDESVVENGDSYRIKCKEIEGNVVPGWFPVIIECKGTSADENKLQPLMPTDLRPESLVGVTNHLIGHITIHNGTKTGNGRMYVLSVGKNSGLGLYKLKTGTAMTDNKVYAEVSEEGVLEAKSVSFFFGDDNDFGITTSIKEVALPEEAAGYIIYDLQGRRVSNPSSGVYIVNGRKLVIK